MNRINIVFPDSIVSAIKLDDGGFLVFTKQGFVYRLDRSSLDTMSVTKLTLKEK